MRGQKERHGQTVGKRDGAGSEAPKHPIQNGSGSGRHPQISRDAGLQFVYIAISIYGWWNWLHGGLEHTELKVNIASATGMAGYLGLAAASTAALYWLLRHYTPSTVPFADGLTVALFLTAQFMMSKKIVQNWWFWIVGDVLVIGLYIYKHLYLTSALYAFFLAMCIAGLLEWQKASRRVAVVAAA